MKMVIKSLNAQNYSGSYEVVAEEWNVAGNINTDGQKNLNNISGSVMKNTMMVLSFNAWGSENNLRWNLNDIADLGELAEALDVITDAVEAVKDELKGNEEE